MLLGVERAAAIDDFPASRREGLVPGASTKKSRKGFLEGSMITGGCPGVSLLYLFKSSLGFWVSSVSVSFG